MTVKEIEKKYENCRLLSIKENRCVKVHKGTYFYKGYQISNDGGNEFPWNYGLDMLCGYECAITKKECIYNIDLEIGSKVNA